MSLEQRHAQLISYLEAGKFAEGIEDFYAEDVVAQENTAEPVQGREQMAATERRFLQKVTAYHGIEVLVTDIEDLGNGTGTVYYQAIMKWDQSDRGPVTVRQSVLEHWKDGRIGRIRFFGNFDPGSLPE